MGVQTILPSRVMEIESTLPPLAIVQAKGFTPEAVANTPTQTVRLDSDITHFLGDHPNQDRQTIIYIYKVDKYQDDKIVIPWLKYLEANNKPWNEPHHAMLLAQSVPIPLHTIVGWTIVAPGGRWEWRENAKYKPRSDVPNKSIMNTGEGPFSKELLERWFSIPNPPKS